MQYIVKECLNHKTNSSCNNTIDTPKQIDFTK